METLSGSDSYTFTLYKGESYQRSYAYNGTYFGSYLQDGTLLDSHIEDEGGIYRLETYAEKEVASPYLEGEKDLLKTYGDRYFLGFKTEGLDLSGNAVSIKDKDLRIRTLLSIDYKVGQIAKLNALEASFEDGKLRFTLSMVNEDKPYVLSFDSLQQSSIERVESYLKNGGGPFKGDADLNAYRERMLSNNYVADTYDLNEKKVVAYEIFHPHYFVQEYLGASSGSGLLEITRNTQGISKGSYLLTVLGSLEKGYTGASVSTSFPYSEEEVEDAYHYPSALEVVENPQYLLPFSSTLSGYEIKGEAYSFDKRSLLLNFAENFSLDKTWDPNTYVPEEVVVDIADKAITFVYGFRYGGKRLNYPIAFHSFGKASIAIVDQLYDRYNA